MDEAIKDAIVEEGCVDMVKLKVVRTIMEDEFLRKNILKKPHQPIMNMTAKATSAGPV